MTPTTTICTYSDRVHLTLLRIRDGEKLDIWDRDKFRADVLNLIWHLTHDPDYLASDESRAAARPAPGLDPGCV